MANLNFSSTLPAAPAGSTNVAFAVDSSNDISASIPIPITGTGVGVGGVVTPRQQLSVGSGLDIYSGGGE